ncbi:MAG: alpha/beta hydrolase [Rudaea sp.]|nr:alpha/beta hydrolase [Rudaea sp.]
MRNRTLSISLFWVLAAFAFCLRAFAQAPQLVDKYAEVNGVRLHYASAGSGKLIVFLHGFPEFWYQWKPQLAEFGKDVQAVAPDMRGYNLSSKPTGVEHYRVKDIVEDIRALAAQLGQKKFVLVGQDWGGAIAWAFALYHPECVEKLVILNAPHPALFDRELRENPAQQLASRYMLGVYDPGLAQAYAADGYAALVKTVLAEGLSNGRFNSDDRKAYIDAWSQPGALESELNYYRAANLGPPDAKHGRAANGNYTPDLASTVVNVPTLLIWGMKDPYLLAGNLSGLGQFVPDLRVKLFADASHWVNREKAAEVNAAIRDFISPQQHQAAR